MYNGGDSLIASVDGFFLLVSCQQKPSYWIFMAYWIHNGIRDTTVFFFFLFPLCCFTECFFFLFSLCCFNIFFFILPRGHEIREFNLNCPRNLQLSNGPQCHGYLYNITDFICNSFFQYYHESVRNKWFHLHSEKYIRALKERKNKMKNYKE